MQTTENDTKSMEIACALIKTWNILRIKKQL